MNTLKRQLGIYIGIFLFSFWAYSQEEEESAAVFLEEYTDEFQENFFEALKQKGIQNYDRAIRLFLECKRLDATNSVVDYELAKAYFLDKQYIPAQKYAIEALDAKPTDFWYLESLMNILEKQGNSLDAIKQDIPYTNFKLRENLAVYFFKKKKYTEALAVLKEMDGSKFATDLTLKINDSIQETKKGTVVEAIEKSKEEEEDNPVARYQKDIEALFGQSDFAQIVIVSKEALDSYPLQPYFHYAYGAALHRTSKSAKAIEVLESALDYLFDDTILANKIYGELASAYAAIGNDSKSNAYLNKIKSGL